MGEGLLLEFTHGAVGTVNFRCNARAITMFCLDGGGETGVVGAQFEHAGALLDCELPLQLFDLGELLFVEATFLTQGLVEGTGFLGGMIRNAVSYETAGERPQKGDDGVAHRSAATDAHTQPVSRVGGASSA